jgi:hypothetical protein
MKVIVGTLGVIAAATAGYGLVRSYGKLMFMVLITHPLKTSRRWCYAKDIHERVSGGHERARDRAKDEPYHRSEHQLRFESTLY